MMSEEQCYECGQSFSRDVLFDLRISRYTRLCWCFNCAQKQLRGGEFLIYIKRGKLVLPVKRIKSGEQLHAEFQKLRDELELCYRAQIDRKWVIWEILNDIATEEIYYYDIH